ncbi:hypothetical protein [Spirulina sp. 06S082]|uniref:hypothetical protein n=1 Tax=Spirulina sp. 06S082 TaxID=3110248 RepID=UPI002B1FCC65|nr:hypothetical protein [Spirulina sp. 06S082]MEA5469133.1 hypothetical protein [Spirulina sp. 06S082]
MTKFWLTTKSTTAALCLLGIGANTALGMESLVPENNLDDCETFDTLSAEASSTDFNTLTCDSSLLEEEGIEEETEVLRDRVEFEEYSDPSWQEDTPIWETSEPLPTETEAEWENVPDAASEAWDTSTPIAETEWENLPDAAPAGTEWENLPDAAPAGTEWENLPDTTLEEWDTSTPIAEAEWENVPDAASENWDSTTGENLPAISSQDASTSELATDKYEGNLEDDPQFQAVLEPENAKAEVAKLTSEDLIRDDRTLSELISPTLEQHRLKTTGLPPEQVISVAKENSVPDIATLEPTVETPLLDRLNADLRRLRDQAEIVTSQSLNAPIFIPQPISFETYQVSFKDDYGTISSEELEQWTTKFEEEFNFENEFSPDLAIDANAIANSIDPQLFQGNLSELGLKIFDTALFKGNAIASSFFNESPLNIASSDAIEIAFNSVLENWETAIGNPHLTQDLATLMPAHLLAKTTLNFAGEMPDLSWQDDDIFTVESAFEELPELEFGNHPFEFGFKQDFLQASSPLLSKKAI